MVKIRQAIVVEGRYDKNTLRQVVDAPVIDVGGFGIMKNQALLTLLRRIAQTRGLVILTDSDGAGFVIRNYLRGALPKEGVFHAYIPDIYGKERRKRAPGKEGKLGVEGMSPEILLEALQRAGVLAEQVHGEAHGGNAITKTDFFAAGLTGGKNSAYKRKQLLKQLSLPERMSTNALLETLNILYTREEFQALVERIEEIP